MSADPQSSVHPGTPRDAAASLVFDDPLSRPSPDDTDRGWGEGAGGTSTRPDADLARFLDEKPPHHL
jgi:acetyl-CoA synthetase